MTDKFKSLIHYVCHQGDREMLGNTKLNKISLFVDMMSFNKNGNKITEEKYVKDKFGPVPQRMQFVVDELKAENKIVIRNTVVPPGYPKKEYISLVEPDISCFSPEEISLIDEVTEYIYHKMSAKEISEKTHTLAWQLADHGEEIPIEAIASSKVNTIEENRIRWARESVGVQI